jgi:hypothetical protein
MAQSLNIGFRARFHACPAKRPSVHPKRTSFKNFSAPGDASFRCVCGLVFLGTAAAEAASQGDDEAFRCQEGSDNSEGKSHRERVSFSVKKNDIIMSPAGGTSSSATNYRLVITQSASSASDDAPVSSRSPVWSYLFGGGGDEELEDEHPEYYMPPEVRERIEHDDTMSDLDKMVIQRLACRKFYVPELKHTFWQDYVYWFCNNHPIICFWFADPRHPLGKHERVMNLISSLAFGLAATCGVVLWFHYEEDRNFNRVLVRLFGVDVTTGMLALLLFSGPLHVIFDLGIFFLQACPPCRAGGFFDKTCPSPHQKIWLWLGAHLAFLVTVGALSLAINVMIIRASIEDDGDDGDVTTDIRHYWFLLYYVLEVVVANFVVFPLGTFTMFSGILGCGRVPGIGGRPYQVRKYERLMARKQKKQKASMQSV